MVENYGLWAKFFCKKKKFFAVGMTTKVKLTYSRPDLFTPLDCLELKILSGLGRQERSPRSRRVTVTHEED